jgi:hypothetical protein
MSALTIKAAGRQQYSIKKFSFFLKGNQPTDVPEINLEEKNQISISF